VPIGTRLASYGQTMTELQGSVASSLYITLAEIRPELEAVARSHG